MSGMPKQGELGKRFRQIVTETNDRGDDILREASRMGVEMMRERISNDHGASQEWARDYGSYPHGEEGRHGSIGGRVASGRMRDSVSSWVSRGGSSKDGKSRMAFGWVRKKDPYFLYQEYGFNHRQAGRRIKGMYALQDTYEDVKVWLDYKFKHLAKGNRN